MPLKFYKPTTPGRRHASTDAKKDVTKNEPEKSLLLTRKQQGGRNNTGRITVRHRGGGARRAIRIVDFIQERYDVPATVIAIEYDPNRGARLALIRFPDGEKRYVIAADGIGVSDTVTSSAKRCEIKVGNRMPLRDIPVGMSVHSIEFAPGKGGMLVRGAGGAAQLLALESGHAQVKLPSGEVRSFSEMCRATIGRVSNPDHNLIRLGKAGRKRHLGIRPSVRGKAMNPVDHPHGGGEGKHPIGLAYPKTPWGKHALGVKTRRKHKWSDQFIVKRRK